MRQFLHALLGFRPSRLATIGYVLATIYLIIGLAFGLVANEDVALRLATIACWMAAILFFLPLLSEAKRKMPEE